MRLATLLFVACAACGRVAFDDRGDGSVVDTGADDSTRRDDAPGMAVRCNVWNAPILVEDLSSTNQDFETALATTGTMIFTSARQGGFTSGALFSARPNGAGGWRDITFRSELNVAQGTHGPAWNGAGTRLYFADFSSGVDRAFTSEWDGTTFSAKQRIAGLPDDVTSIAIAADELEMIWSGVQDISLFFASRATVTDAWTPRGKVPLAIDGLNGWPSLTGDGLVLYWEHDMTGAVGVYRATRASRAAAWGTPEFVANLGAVGDPEISPDGTQLFLSRGTPDSDIYVSTCE